MWFKSIAMQIFVDRIMGRLYRILRQREELSDSFDAIDAGPSPANREGASDG